MSSASTPISRSSRSPALIEMPVPTLSMTNPTRSLEVIQPPPMTSLQCHQRLFNHNNLPMLVSSLVLKKITSFYKKEAEDDRLLSQRSKTHPGTSRDDSTSSWQSKIGNTYYFQVLDDVYLRIFQVIIHIAFFLFSFKINIFVSFFHLLSSVSHLKNFLITYDEVKKN